ncbi:unnamed protein product (macronuclear) [Paramecium tetraurelia]|uniref:Transmembrane protein n=1 Tax=Paramecium tetraurelia TaxID=5888 RepID=A0BIV1_PARTE|nr:uncharacterized protein GSPATT00004841001 [Paramecium tetraurelia]CAK58468.1 unnamed protein product [Paramecium tetraurelia]|eukprot:XP_001425866.1 hypothetical protein (macronuclear) [Paramecium tetraurelia strain d4-2]
MPNQGNPNINNSQMIQYQISQRYFQCIGCLNFMQYYTSDLSVQIWSYKQQELIEIGQLINIIAMVV